MGFCWSCCRRQKHTGDREPLLPKGQSADCDNLLPPPQSPTERIADALGALQAGKLPSQGQISRVLRTLSHSQIFDGLDGADDDALSESGRKVISDVRDTIDAILQVGLEKNYDDKVQDVLYKLSRADSAQVHADVAVDTGSSSAADLDAMDALANAMPSQQEVVEDVQVLGQSCITLARVLATSSAFRTLLSDVLSIARDTLADTASTVGRVASQVEQIANTVEDAARSSDVPLEDPEGEVSTTNDEPTLPRSSPESPGVRKPDNAKDDIVRRLQQAMIQANRDPTYRRALRTVLVLLQKYSHKISVTMDGLSDVHMPALTPVIWLEEPAAGLVEDLKVLLERFASGRSVDPVLRCLQLVANDIGTAPEKLSEDSADRRELQDVFSDLGSWIDRALADPGFPASYQGRSDAELLYDRMQALRESAIQSDAQWARHIRDLMDELDTFISALADDRSTRRLIDALDTLTVNVSRFGSIASGVAPIKLHNAQKRWRSELQRDLIGWLLPRVLRAVRAIPMPRVEYSDKTVDVAVDALYLSSSAAASFAPDRIHVENYNAVHLDLVGRTGHDAIAAGVPPGSLQTFTRTRVHIDGLRLSARNIGYYVNYRGWRGLLGYQDEGLLSVEVGQDTGQGLRIDLEVEMQNDNSSVDSVAESKELFRVIDVQVSVPGLNFSLDRSRHWILNKLLFQPLAGRFVRLYAGNYLQQQIRTALQALSEIGAEVHSEAVQMHGQDESAGPSYEDYWDALLHTFRARTVIEDEDDDDDPDVAVETHTHTLATAQGFIRTTTETQQASDPSTPEESVLAIGVGPQILPGKGGPYDANSLDQPEYGPTDIAREALEEVQGAADEATENVEAVVEGITEVREQIEVAVARQQITQRVEQKKAGWRSRAFDI